jgi:hypothetical protein
MDNRIRNLTTEVSTAQLLALIETLTLAIDDPTFLEVEKVKYKNFLNSAVITNRDNNYQAMTPQAFYDTLMSTTVKGIGKVAMGYEARDKIIPSNPALAGNYLLYTGHQAEMQSQWKKDWFISNGIPTICIQNATPLAVEGGAIAWQTVWKGDLPTSNPGTQLSPVLPTGVQLYQGYCTIVVTSDSHVYSGVLKLPYYSSEQLILLEDWFALSIPAERTGVFIKTMIVNQTNVRVSITANYTTR